MAELERQPLDWMSRAPMQVSVSRHIDATPEAVWTVLADHERWPDWFPSLTGVEVTGAAEGVGAQRRVHVKGLGAFDEVFLAWEPGRQFGFSVTHMTRPVFKTLNELITIDQLAPDRVEVTYTQAFVVRAWAAPLFELAARRSLPTALAAGLDGLADRAAALG